MHTEEVFILAIESSCDDTAAAVLRDNKVLSNVVARESIHEEYGGVVPELASRAHQQNIVPVIDVALKKANVTKEQLSAIAFTQGPGLMGSLLVGSSFAKSLSMALDIPLIAVNHMHAHILAHFIDEEGFDKPTFPFLALTISGGHTQIVKVNDFFHMEIIGETTDDAVGEADDNTRHGWNGFLQCVGHLLGNVGRSSQRELANLDAEDDVLNGLLLRESRVKQAQLVCVQVVLRLQHQNLVINRGNEGIVVVNRLEEARQRLIEIGAGKLYLARRPAFGPACRLDDAESATRIPQVVLHR